MLGIVQQALMWCEDLSAVWRLSVCSGVDLQKLVTLPAETGEVSGVRQGLKEF